MKRYRKDGLIPFAEKKRVIYTEKRGRDRRQVSAASAVASATLTAVGALCVLYCISIALFVGYGTRFFLVWGLLGICLIGLGQLRARRAWTDRIPKWLRKIFAALSGILLMVFVAVEGLIFWQFGSKASAGADYCLILGAQMKENGPSDTLRRRLDAAIAYLEDNPGTRAIVSGGQGTDEHVTEAKGMADYLEERGIAPERILLEEQSGNTYENLYYSGLLIRPLEDKVVLVTNNFHVFRALGIARKMGYGHVEGLAASSYPYMVPNNLLREFFGIVKDFWVGNL